MTKRRKDSFFGLHFDFHAVPENGKVGRTLKEEEIREICTLLKPDFLQIDCKGHPGWASYPTKCGNAMDSFEGDPLALWRRVTAEENVALYMHYSGVWDGKYCAENPGQCVVNADGTLQEQTTRTNGKYVDELLIPQLMELAGEYGVDGIWIDGDCWGSQPDFHPDTLAAFERETGIELGGKLPATPEDSYYEEFREYCRELFRRYVRHYTDTVHAQYPDFQIASNWAYTDHMPEPVSANTDFISGDLNPLNGFNSARYAGRAIAQQNRTWDLMSWNFRWNNANGKPAGIPKHPVQIMQEAAAVIALGGGFQNYITQYKDGAPRIDQIRRMKAVADFMREREPYCFRGTFRHEAALLLSTYDRHLESESLFSRNGCEKIMGMTALMCDAGQSVEIVSEHTLKDNYDAYKLIVIPELYAGLAPETVQELLSYVRRGGSLMLIGENTCKLFAEAGTPFTVGEPADPQAWFTMDGVSYGCVMRPCVVGSYGEIVAQICDEPSDEKYAFAAVAGLGKGKIAAVGADIGSQYLDATQYLYRDLVKQLCDRLYTPTVRVEVANGLLEVVCLEKNGHLMVQLVNANGNHANPNSMTEDQIPAVTDVMISVACENAPEALILQPEGRKLAFEYRDGRAYVWLDKLGIHSILEVIE